MLSVQNGAVQALLPGNLLQLNFIAHGNIGTEEIYIGIVHQCFAGLLTSKLTGNGNDYQIGILLSIKVRIHGLIFSGILVCVFSPFPARSFSSSASTSGSMPSLSVSNAIISVLDVAACTSGVCAPISAKTDLFKSVPITSVVFFTPFSFFSLRPAVNEKSFYHYGFASILVFSGQYAALGNGTYCFLIDAQPSRAIIDVRLCLSQTILNLFIAQLQLNCTLVDVIGNNIAFLHN